MMRSMTAAVAFGLALGLPACSDEAGDGPSAPSAAPGGAGAAAATPEIPETRPSLTYYTIPG